LTPPNGTDGSSIAHPLTQVMPASSRAATRCAFARSAVWMPDASPYADAETDARAILDRLRVLLAFAQRESISVIGLGDVPEILGA
jgi:hypothetical protein